MHPIPVTIWLFRVRVIVIVAIAVGNTPSVRSSSLDDWAPLMTAMSYLVNGKVLISATMLLDLQVLGSLMSMYPEPFSLVATISESRT